MKRNLVLMLAFLFVLTSSTFGAYQVYYDEPAGDLFIPSFPGQVDIHMKFDTDDTLSGMVDPFTWAGSSAGVSLIVKTCDAAGWFAGSALLAFDSKICGPAVVTNKYMVNGLRFMDPNALIMPGTNKLLAVWSFTVTNENDILCLDSTFISPSNRLKWVRHSEGTGVFPFIAPQICWTIKKTPNMPPVPTCPANASTYHTTVAGVLTATDAETDPLTATVSFGALAPAGYGTWNWTANFAGQPLGPMNVIFSVNDGINPAVFCTTVITVQNRPPDITNCPLVTLNGNKNVEICYTFTVTEPDGDPFTWFASVGSFVGNKWCYTFTSAGTFPVTVIVTETPYLAADTCTFNVFIPTTTPFGGTATIGIPLCANPGDMVTVPITVSTVGFESYGVFDVGGFEFEIEFDPTTLYFIRAERGAAIPKETWDFFTYRQLPCPSCGCCKYKLELVGIAEMPGGVHGVCLPVGQTSEVAKLVFQVASDNNLRGYCLPICFEFEDAYCTENVLSNCNGNKLVVAQELWMFEDCDPQYPVLLDSGAVLFPYGTGCPPAHEDLDVIHALKFYCGGVKVCDLGGECVIGDINLNGVKYEVADAVLFASYFIHGPSVFTIKPDTQKAATDVNRDGRILTVSDLVYLVRIILKDAVPLPKLTPNVNTLALSNTAGVISANTEIPVGAAVFVFKGVGTPTLLAGSMEMLYANNGTETRVLVWSTNGNSFSSGDVISVSGNVELVAVEAADHIGNALNTTLSKGVAKADAFELKAAYPNPFNLRTTIEFAIKTDAKVNLKVYNVSGQYVKTLVDEEMSAGRYTTTWDGTNYAGEVVSSGIYFYKMVAGNYSSTQKMVLLK